MSFRLILACTIIISAIACNNTSAIEKTKESISETATIAKPDSLLRHVVMFKFKDDATASQIKVIEDSFHALPSKISAIHDYEWGINNSPEGLNKDLTHCFFVTFKTEEDRTVYLPHPDHMAFVDVLKPILDDVTVFDYWAK